MIVCANPISDCVPGAEGRSFFQKQYQNVSAGDGKAVKIALSHEIFSFTGETRLFITFR